MEVDLGTVIAVVIVSGIFVGTSVMLLMQHIRWWKDPNS